MALGKYVEAAIIAGLLAFNAALGFFQEGRAQATLAALKSRLALNASVRRDNAWATVPAAGLVPGDIVKLSLGAVVAADVRLIEGEILLDQSMLTGESMPIEAGPGLQTYAGALVRRGEAVAEVTATGARTKFGRTAELVRTAHVDSSQQKAVLRVVRNLAMFNGVIIVMLVAYAYALKLPIGEIIPLVLTAVLASIPVALPATFTLAAALGARALAHLGVLPTRLSAVDEAASIDVLCADKTGTLTRNELKVTAVRPMPGFDEAHVLGLAALASSDGGQDPVDAAIRSAASQAVASDLPKLTKFVPFDPATKMSEATAVDPSGATMRIVKGAFAAVMGLTPTIARCVHDGEPTGGAGLPGAGRRGGSAGGGEARGNHRPQRSAANGFGGAHHGVAHVGRPHRHGDGRCAGDGCDRGSCGRARWSRLSTRADPRRCTTRGFRGLRRRPPGGKVQPRQGVPEERPHRWHVRRRRQRRAGAAPGTDGNRGVDRDRRRQVGGRHRADRTRARRHRRFRKGRPRDVPAHPDLYAELGYQEDRAGALPGGGSGHDRARDPDSDADGHPNDHRRFPRHVLDDRQRATVTDAQCLADRQLTIAGVFMGVSELVFCTAVLAIGKFRLGLGIETLRTLAFVVIVFGNQATTYPNRERQRLGSPRPSLWLIGSSVVDLLIASTLATCGIAMAPLPIFVVGGTLVAAAVFALILDFAKVPVFKRLKIA